MIHYITVFTIEQIIIASPS